MKYLLILLVVGLAVAPLTHFLPSKRQRQVARMREHAAVHGLFVEFRDLPGRTDRPGQRSEQVIYYGKRLAPSRKKARNRQAWLPLEEGWRGLEHRDVAPDCTARLPASAMAVSVDEGSCGMYWLERGDEEEVQLIVEALDAWSGELNGEG